MSRTLKVGVWFALAVVVGLVSTGRSGASATPAAAKAAPARGAAPR
jgi:hypothetical protein